MSYEVLARKYRPQTFSGLTGQEHVSQTLQNAIDSGRVAHAFLFTGARGVGKTSAARILAKALTCEQGPANEPCNHCNICQEITAGTCTDVFEIDGASNTGVDDIRELRDNSRYLPSHCRYKIYIIDEVHMLSNNAFNALLKTLEEPPPHVKFIFATTEPHKLPVTILSRCQRFDFKRVPLQRMITRLREIAEAEHISISDASLTMIAHKGDGSMRDAITSFDQVLAFSGNTVSDEAVITLLGVVDRELLHTITIAILHHNQQQVLELIEQVRSYGYSIRQFCHELIDFMRSLLVVSTTQHPERLLDLPISELERLKQLTTQAAPGALERYCALLLKAEAAMAGSGFQFLQLELALLKMCQLQPVVPVTELIERIQLLETGRATTSGSLFSESPKPVKQVPLPEQKELLHKQITTQPGGSPWESLVGTCRQRKPSLAALIEHGTPILFDEENLEIGFPEKSYFLNMMQDSQNIAALQEILESSSQASIRIRITAIGEKQETSPLSSSIVEKKKQTELSHQESIEQTVQSHPHFRSITAELGAETIDIVKATPKKMSFY